MISYSMRSMATGSAFDAEHTRPFARAGHRRPVNSGKLLVACRRSIASDQSSWYTRSFHSGMRLPSGQPSWQKGMPQSMHRAPCCEVASGANGS